MSATRGTWLGLALACLAPACQGQSQTHQDYGEPIGSLSDLTPLEAITAAPQSFAGKTVTVKGVIASVCPTSGCFFHLGAGSTQLRVDLNEAGFTVPPGRGAGQIAFARGVVRASGNDVFIAGHAVRILGR